MKVKQILYCLAALVALVGLFWPATLSAQANVTCENAYTVQPGDWLGKVAAQTYGDAALYPAIAAATNANLGPDYVNFIGANNVILPGWKLCLPSQADAVTLAAAATDDPATLTVDDLQNATYTEYAEAAPVTLVNGEYRQPVPDSTGEEVYSLADTFAFADFDGDGSEDALAVLISDTAGTGRFFTLMLLLNKNGVPTQADNVSLGDRSPMKAINRVGGDIYVDYITQGPNDAACCATQATSQKFRVENGKLVTSEAGIQASQTSEAMTREKLGNIAYPIDEGEQITFVNGKYVGQPEGEGSASFAAAEMLAPLAFGDLTGDGVEDAVVTFSYSGGGSGDFLYLAVAEGKGAEPVGQASLWLDTAGKINGVAVDNGQVKVDVLRFGPGDAECCATEHAVVTYALQDGTLVEGEAQVITPSAAASEAAALTVAELQNATYSGIYEEPVTLTNGKYEGEPFDEGGSSRPTVEYWGEVFGDLDGDGLEDAAVFLVENSGGTGNFVYVSAQLNQNGQPVDAGTVSIEDRIQVKSAAIENGQIKLEITTEGPGDAACCKSHKTNKTYALQNGTLAEIPGPEEALEKISATDLNGTTWTLLELNPDQSALADTPVTISFADGKISGSGGCNNYNGGFSLAEDNPFGMTVGPVVSTKTACPDPVLNQETAYFTALEKVSQWGYRIGRLVMYYDKGQGEFGTLLFAPPAQEPEIGQAPAPAPGERITSVVELTAVPVQWLSFTDPTQQFDIANPENYTIAFNPDGTVNVKADCNNAAGTYTAADSGSLTIQLGPMTLAACPPGSRSDEFVQKLGFVRNFFMENGFVYLDMLADGGTLKLAPASAVEGSTAQAGQFLNLEKITCPEFVSTSPFFADEVAGETYECGVVEVPENYALPSGRTIELVYLRLFSPVETPMPDPLLYLSGGPGSSALREAASHDTLKSNLQFVREKRDLIFYDQRGTGLTAPLNCGPVQAAIGAAVEILPDRAEEIRAIESDTEKIESDTTKAQIFNNAVCAGGYATVGVDLAQYNSIASAKDMASLMSALGYEQYNLYGTSYGTKLAQVALRETPDRVRQAVLDGTSPVSQPQMANSFIEFNEQYVRLFAQCAADPACNEAYPNLPERFTALLNRLKDNPIVLEDPIVPVGLMALLVDKPVETIDLSFFNTLINVNNAVQNHEWGDQLSIAGQIPRTILALEEGDLEYVRGLFTMPDIGAAPVDEIQTFSGEISILPDNEYIAPTIDTLLAEAQQVPAVASASTPAQQWVALVINHLVARLQSGDKQTDVISDMIDLTFLPTQGRAPQLLIDYANEFLPEDMAAQANALVETMTPADVRATMWHLNEVAEAMRFNPEPQPGLHEAVTWAVNCAEDLSLRPADAVDEVIAAAAYPQLALGDKKAYGFFELGCSFFPKTIVPPSFIEPVVSDIPTLFFQGDLDAATPPSQARTVASHLTNATFVLFGSEGHIVMSKTPSCPGTITAQFLDNPAGKLDTSCADAFRINFELP